MAVADTDGLADSSTAALEDSADQGDGDAGGATPEGENVPFNEHPRWKQVYAELKTYKALGSPEELSTAKATLAEAQSVLEEVQGFRQLVAKARAEREALGGGKTEDERAAEAQYAKAKEQLKKIAPELFETVEEIRQAKEAQQAALAHQAEARKQVDATAMAAVSTLMAKHGLESTPEAVDLMSEQLVAIAKRDPEILDLYFKNPNKAVQMSWDKYFDHAEKLSSRKTAAAQQAKGVALKGLPRNHSSGPSGAGSAGSAPPTTLKEAFAFFPK